MNRSSPSKVHPLSDLDGYPHRRGIGIEPLSFIAGSASVPPACCRALSVGLLSGGYGQEELERAGAYRVYQDPADLLRRLDEVGVRSGG
jgi:hypothetical protein